jgi:hypothetical protein
MRLKLSAVLVDQLAAELHHLFELRGPPRA